MGKNVSKNLSGKYNQKLLGHAKQSPTEALKTDSKRANQKTAETAVICLIIKLLIKLQKSRKLHHMGKNISKNLSGKYNQKLLDHAKQSSTDALKTGSKTGNQKTAETTLI